MDYMVRSRGDDLEIDIPEPGSARAAIVDTIQQCCEGTCECPTDEVRKVSAIEVDPGAEALSMTLHPQPGQHLDVVEIDRAIHWVIESTEG
ncbi:MAG TPA: hypothetical protein VLD62_03360 [Acidimicrobiia bacterium]|nr:hypothetical protein [Acidimicrobiia bacterium]